MMPNSTNEARSPDSSERPAPFAVQTGQQTRADSVSSRPASDALDATIPDPFIEDYVSPSPEDVSNYGVEAYGRALARLMVDATGEALPFMLFGPSDRAIRPQPLYIWADQGVSESTRSMLRPILGTPNHPKLGAVGSYANGMEMKRRDLGFGNLEILYFFPQVSLSHWRRLSNSAPYRAWKSAAVDYLRDQRNRSKR